MAWKSGDSKAEKWFSAFMIVEAVWSFLTLLTVSSVSFEMKLFWYKVFLPVAVTITIPLLIYTLYYTGRKHLVTKPLLGLLIVSAYALLITAPDLVVVNPHLDTSGSIAQLEYSRGIGHWAYGTVAFSIVTVSLTMLFLKFLRSRNVYRKISFFMFASTFIMSSLAFISFVGLSPLPHFMLLPFSVIVFGTVSILAMTSKRFIQMIPIERILSRFSSKFESLVPVARDFVVEEIDNGVIVLDNSDRIVDINSTAKEILGVERAVGKKVYDIFGSQRIDESDKLSRAIEEKELRELDDEVRMDTS
ncbi:MAG: histidine kinase N-terminal 7TM domain-containing protein, partial [Halobacteria archaeon]|nr:histidine kinase N-terminal 7TM domain-containing protein [Halobacteria archaeon]